MSYAASIAWKVALAGAILGAFFVLRDNLALWQTMPNLDTTQAAARVFGGALGGAVLGGLGGYAFGRFRRKKV
jgi:hypothetical protein